MKPLVTIAGPTASGKTELALALARHFHGEVIGADSMQIYREIAIGTAKPTAEECGGIPYHLIDFVPPWESYTVSQFKDDALAVIERLHQKNTLPILCGGTGLYVNAILYEMDFTNGSYDLDYRKSLEDQPLDTLLAALQSVDPKTYAEIDRKNRRRVIRALEIYHLTKMPKSSQVRDYRQHPRPFDHHVYILNRERDELYDRINRRVDWMMENGLIEEVERLKTLCSDTMLPIFQFIGYKEILCYLAGKFTKAQAAEEIKKNTRHFAKRQLTWFRKLAGIPRITWIQTTNDKDRLSREIIRRIEGERQS